MQKVTTVRGCVFFFCMLVMSWVSSQAQTRDDIVGFWISAQKNVIVQIYSDSPYYRGRLAWFDDTDDPSQPMKLRMDVKNPIKSLRTQKILGLDVLTGLMFDADCKCWQEGNIYDTQTGKTWNATVYLENINQVRVRGFWHFQFFGKSMTFTRYQFPKGDG